MLSLQDVTVGWLAWAESHRFAIPIVDGLNVARVWSQEVASLSPQSYNSC